MTLGALVATALLPRAAAASDPPGPCESGYVAPTPTAVPVTSVPITVSSTTADYFVLYVRSQPPPTSGNAYPAVINLPVSVTRGEAGTTTLADNLAPLSADRYRVEKYSVANPGDLDGDCVDDLTELADLGKHNPINPGKAIDRIYGTVSIDSLETFQELSFDGESGFKDVQRNQEFIKFSIWNVETDNPTTYFINTNTTVSHGSFLAGAGIPFTPGKVFARGQIVYHPNVQAPDGSLGIYRFSFDAFERGFINRIASFNEILAAAMPLVENNLFYYPFTSEQVSLYKRDKSNFDASRVNILRDEDINANVDFSPLNQAEGYGRLRLMGEDDRPSPFDVAIYQTLPNDLPRVAGTITTVPQTPLSHVNLRAIQNGLPNAFIRDAHEDDAIKALIGGYVYFAVTAEGYTIRSATKKEVDDHHEQLRPKTTQTLQRDLTVKTITALKDVSFADWTAFGVKAANVAELTKLSLPAGTAPSGFAVPFYFYDEFMKQATVAEQTILGKKKAPAAEKITLAAGTTLAAAVDAMLAHSYFQSDADIQEEMLDDLRDAIKDATSPKFVTDALTAVHATYPDGQSLRYRSSTNNEDLPSFNGAGLYSSKTQRPDETTDDGIDKSLKQVWASLWNYRAFLERDFHRVDHTTVAMGVLVHPNYDDESVNGVAVSYDPITFQDNVYYVNSQVGEDLVTNPEANSEPEQLLLGSTGKATVLSRSNLAASNALLMTSAQMVQLRSNLDTIHNRFKTLYQVQAGDDFAIEIEFKITAGNKLAIKQARPWIFAAPLTLSPSTVTIALDATQTTEGAGLELTATREGGVMSRPLTIDLTWSETGAMLNSVTPASVTIPSNQTSTTIAVPIDDDTEDEHDSVVSVSIAANSGYIIGTANSASATVTDDDLTNIAVRADAGTVTEGSSGGFTFTRSGSVLEQSLTVGITVSESGNRLVGTMPTEVTFAANSATTSISFATTDDSVRTDASVVTVQIGAGSDYGIAGAGSAKVTVGDDEPPPPTLFFDFNHAAAGGRPYVLALDIGSGSKGALSLALSGPDIGDFVDYTFADIVMLQSQRYDHPADANQDGVYEIDLTATNSLGGSTTARLRFTVTNAELIALAEQLWDQLTLHERVALLPEVEDSRLRPAFASLQADVRAIALRLARQQHLPSPGPTISVTADGDITEGGDATFTVTADPVPSAALDVTVSVSQTGDFGVTPGSRTVSIPTTGSAPLTVTTGDDSVGEADGSVTATVDRGTGYVVSFTAGAATAAVADDDAGPPPTTPEISIAADGDVTEGGDATFTVTASPVPAAPLDVTVSVSQTGDYGVTPGSHTVTIPTSGSAALTVTTSDDSVDEADGSVTATVDSGQGYTVSATAGAATVSVADDDVPAVSIAAGLGVTEGGTAGFTVSASPTPASPLSVSVSVTQSGDFGVTTGSRTVIIPASGSASLSVLTGDDSADEPDGSVTATVDSGSGYTVSSTAGAATVAVADDDAAPPPPAKPEVSLTAGADVTEGDDATFTVTASPVPAAPLDVTVSVSQTGDFVATGSRTVTVPTSGSVSLTVSTIEDSVDEADGSVTATVDSGSGYTVSATAGAATVAVADDDAAPPPPACVLPSDAVTVSEVEGWRDGHSGAAHVLRWNRVLEALGEDTGSGATPLTASESEAYESVFMFSRWDRVTRTLEARALCNNPPPPPTPEISITAAGAGVTEGDDATFTVTANPVPTSTLDVTVSVSQTGDFVATGSRTVTVPTSGSATLTLLTIEDSTDEADGSVTATVDSGSGYTVSATAGAATVNVADDDVPEVSIAAGSGVTEGDPATFTVTASPVPASPLTVTVAVTQSGDFGATTGSRTVIIPTTGSAPLSVATGDDSADEPHGAVTVTVVSGAGYTVSATAGAATVDVADDDDAPPPACVLPSDAVTESEVEGWRDAHSGAAHVLRWNRVLAALGVDTGVSALTVSESRANESVFMFSRWDRVTRTLEALTLCDNPPPPPPPATPEVSIAAGADVTEGDDATFTVTANPVPAAPLDVSVTVSQTGDFGVTAGSRTVTIPTSGSVPLSVSTGGDSVDEPDGSVTATVDSGSGYTVSSTAGAATVAVADDDVAPPTCVLPSDAVTVAEVEGWRDAHSGAAHVLRWNRVLEALGEDTGVPSITALTVEESRANESLFSFSRWDRVTRTLEALAVCNPPPLADPVISVTAGSGVTEGDDAEFTVTADPAPAADLTVTVAVSATGDYGVTAASRTVTVPTTGSVAVSVATVGDSVDEADGSVAVTVSAGQGYTVSATAGSATVSVADDDVPEVSIAAGADVTEGGRAGFTVTASPKPGSSLRVDYTVTHSGDFGVSASSGHVYVSTGGSATFSIATVDDSTDEPDGSVTVTLSTGAGYTVSTTAGSATVDVADDDDPPPPTDVTVSIADASAQEGGEVRFTVTLSKAASHEVRVRWDSTPYYGVAYPQRAAIASREFWLMDGWLVFAPGETTKTDEVFLNDDSSREHDEVFRVMLSQPQGATIADGEGVMTIIDDD